MNESIMNDLRFYIDLYVDEGFTHDEAKTMAIKLLSMIGVFVDEQQIVV